MDYGYRFSGALHPAFHTQKKIIIDMELGIKLVLCIT